VDWGELIQLVWWVIIGARCNALEPLLTAEISEFPSALFAILKKVVSALLGLGIA